MPENHSLNLEHTFVYRLKVTNQQIIHKLSRKRSMRVRVLFVSNENSLGIVGMQPTTVTTGLHIPLRYWTSNAIF